MTRYGWNWRRVLWFLGYVWEQNWHHAWRKNSYDIKCNNNSVVRIVWLLEWKVGISAHLHVQNNIFFIFYFLFFLWWQIMYIFIYFFLVPGAKTFCASSSETRRDRRVRASMAVLQGNRRRCTDRAKILGRTSYRSNTTIYLAGQRRDLFRHRPV